jgi:hypothetical protein
VAVALGAGDALRAGRRAGGRDLRHVQTGGRQLWAGMLALMLAAGRLSHSMLSAFEQPPLHGNQQVKAYKDDAQHYISLAGGDLDEGGV